MKKGRNLLLMALCAIALISCQRDTVDTPKTIQGESGNVNFKIKANIGEQIQGKMRAIRPEYTPNSFSIYAFKNVEGTQDYIYQDVINLTNYDINTHIATGSKNLPIGTYKFLPAYGVNQSVLTLPTWNGNLSLTDNLNIQYNTSGPLNSEIFLKTDDEVADLTTYSIGLQQNNVTVTDLLKRAVGRVDIMFISADKNGTEYTEKPYVVNGNDVNIFGGRQVEEIYLNFTNINNTMNFFGDNRTGTKSSYRVALDNLQNRITLGTAGNTSIGDIGYSGYDNVQESDIISGSAHVFGTYLFPNNDNQRNVGMSIDIKLANLPTRTINLNFDNRPEGNYLPIERNKVTLVKIYVLNDNNVGTSTAEFEYELEVVWEDANEVEGEIS